MQAWHSARRAASAWMLVLGPALLAGGSWGCEEYGLPAGTSPHREFNFLDMGDQPKMKAQRGDLLGGPSFMPAPGSIPRGFHPYRYVGQPEQAERNLKNPLSPGDVGVAARGKEMFERLCVPCHGMQGAGDGTVVAKGFPQPPSLMTQKIRDWGDGHIYHVISEGQNIMPSYAAQTKPHDRWAVIRHIRTLQSSLPVAAPLPGASSAASPSASAIPPAPTAQTDAGVDADEAEASVDSSSEAEPR